MGIVTTTSRGNVEALLARHLGSRWSRHFATVVCANEAPRKKPDPQVYRLALAALRLHPHQAVAIEDAPAGIEAAQRAGVPVMVAHSHYFPACAAAGALAVGPSLGRSEGWQPPPIRAPCGSVWSRSCSGMRTAPGSQRIPVRGVRRGS